MTVIKAIEELQKQNPNAQLMISIDPEGNGYSQVDEVDGDAWFTNGDLYGPEDKRPKGAKKVVVLWPK